jgi:hypothetical protein
VTVRRLRLQSGHVTICATNHVDISDAIQSTKTHASDAQFVRQIHTTMLSSESQIVEEIPLSIKRLGNVSIDTIRFQRDNNLP